MDHVTIEPTWVPEACSLPTAEQPLRVADVDRVLATAVVGVPVVEPGRAVFQLVADPAVAARVAELVVRESQCCSFFTFDLVVDGAGVRLEVSVPPAHEPVLRGLAARVVA